MIRYFGSDTSELVQASKLTSKIGYCLAIVRKPCSRYKVNLYLDFVQQTASEQETYQAAINNTADRQIIVKLGAFFDVSQNLQEQSSMHLERSTMRTTQVLDMEPTVIIRIP